MIYHKNRVIKLIKVIEKTRFFTMYSSTFYYPNLMYTFYYNNEKVVLEHTHIVP